MRIAQPPGTKGSLKWLQRAVACRPDLLQPAALPPLVWVSPLAGDDFAEYRDAAFLARLGLGHLAPALAGFWPRRGPQWDALARFDGGVVLVEAKAHLPEFESPPSAAGPTSRARIAQAFAQVQEGLGLAPSDWSQRFYQYANRLAHLWWLRAQGVEAHLLLAGFLGDTDLAGPATPEPWRAAYARADATLGLPSGHALAPFVHHVFPPVAALEPPFATPAPGLC